jgi:hypothetical protein
MRHSRYKMAVEMCAAVPTCRSLMFICGKLIFHKLMEKSECQSIKIDGKSVCVPSVHLCVTTEELPITRPLSLVLESFSKTSLHIPVVIEIRQQEWTHLRRSAPVPCVNIYRMKCGQK